MNDEEFACRIKGILLEDYRIESAGTDLNVNDELILRLEAVSPTHLRQIREWILFDCERIE